MEAPPLERKLAAILAADVEGYSRLMHADEEKTLATLTSHRSIIDGLISAANGQIFGTAGDSVLAEFPSVVQAFDCAVAIQQALRRANAELSEEQRMRFRIGINVGDVMVKSDDIFGDGVNIAARLESLAQPGGICVTRGVRDHLRDRVKTEFEDLGEQSVKNIARPVRVFRVNFDPDAEPSIEITTPVAASSSSQSDSLTDEKGGEASTAEVVFWESLQAKNDPEEYQIYLERYPEGLFAELARSRLKKQDVPDDAAVERDFWDTIRDSGNREMIKAYVDKYPKGEFVSLAKIMMDELDGKD